MKVFGARFLFLRKPRLLATNISQRVACARVVTHTHCQSNLSLPMQFTCCGLTPCITFTDFIVWKSFYCKSAREKNLYRWYNSSACTFQIVLKYELQIRNVKGQYYRLTNWCLLKRHLNIYRYDWWIDFNISTY